MLEVKTPEKTRALDIRHVAGRTLHLRAGAVGSLSCRLCFTRAGPPMGFQWVLVALG